MPRIRPAPARAPRLLVALWLLLALAPYLASYRDVGFLSEDFTALDYASDFSRAASDLGGAQYGLEQPRFYRPWITLSLALESALFGFSPALLKLSNLGLFAAGLLAFRALARRLGCDPVRAAFAALLCAWFPFGAGSVLWLVGRVDAHLFGFGMAFLAFHARAFRTGENAPESSARRRAALAAGACLVLALLAKETAVALVPILLVLDALHGRSAPFAARFARLAPFVALGGIYLAWRAYVLGAWIGGYAGGSGVAGAPADLLEKLVGLLRAFGSTLLAGPRAAAEAGSPWHADGVAIGVGAIAILLAAGAVWRLARRDAASARLVLAGVTWAFVAALPLLQLWNDPAFATNARVYLLAWAGIALACAAALRALPRFLQLAAALCLLALAGSGLLRNTSDHVDASRAVESLRARVIAASDANPGRPAILFDVPTHVGTAYAMAFGLREALRPPFAPSPCEVVAWRALFPAAPPLPSLAALPTLELEGFGPRVRLAFLASLGSAVGEIALPLAPRRALSIFEVFVRAPILSSGEGALYVPLEVLDKGGDRIWMYAESLDERGEANGPVSDLLELRFTPSFRAMMRKR